MREAHKMQLEAKKYYTRVTDRKSALRLYRRLINDYTRELVTDKRAWTLARLLDGYLKAEKDYKLEEIEAKILELERTMKVY